MELPHLGQHCHDSTCNRLDFLPLKCDSCDHNFCSAHFNYEKHACKGARKDTQVPVCPLCNKPVPTAPGVAPDLTVSRHIDQQCKSQQKKIFTNRCNVKGCKRKELIPVACTVCKINFCLPHRHPVDHECQGKVAKTNNQKSLAAEAAEKRANKQTSLPNNRPSLMPALQKFFSGTNSQNTPGPTQRLSNTHVQNIQGNMSEDEALARALALSISEHDESANSANNATTTHHSPTVKVGGNNQQQNVEDKCSLS